MSDEIKSGDFRVALGRSFEVLATWDEYIWVKWEDSVVPECRSIAWTMASTKPKPDFFEKNKNYKLYGKTYSTWHIHQMAHEKVAVAQDTYGIPVLLTEGDWETFKSYDGFK